MTCFEARNKLEDYLRGALNPPESERVLIHYAHCRDCNIILDSIRETLALFSEASQLPQHKHIHAA